MIDTDQVVERDGWYPQSAGEGTVDRLEGAQPVLAGAVEVGTDSQPVGGTCLGLMAAGDLHLGFDRTERALPGVVGEQHPAREVGEAQHVSRPA